MAWTLREESYAPDTATEGDDISEDLSNQPENDPDD